MSKMQVINIREIEINDYKDIYLLIQELNPKLYSYSVEKVKERIKFITENTKDIIFVIEQNKEIIGYIHGSPYELLFSDSLISILGFVIKEKYRNNGMGSMLIKKLECWAIDNGYYGVKLQSRFERINAHRFYEKHGYINTKNQRSFIKIFK